MFARILNVYRAAFAGLPRDVWRLAFAVLVNRSGAMVLPFLGLYVTEARGLPESAAAAVLVAYGCGSIGGTIAGGALCNRVGALKVQQLSLVGAGFCYFIIPITRSFPLLLAVVALASFVADAFRPATMTAVVDAAPGPVRTRALALIRLAANLGFSVGPTVGGILASFDYFWLFVGDAVTCWMACFVIARAARRQVPPPGAHASGAPGGADNARRAAHRDGPFLGLLALSFVLTLALFQTFSTLPLFLHDSYGLGERTIGLLLGSNGLMIALFEMVLLRRVEVYPPLRVVAIGSALLCGGLALLPLGRGILLAIAAMTVLTVGEMLSLPMTNSLAASRGGPGSRGAYMGMYSAAFSAAFIVAPPAGLFIYSHFGGNALWFAVGGLAPLLAAGSLLLGRAFRADAGGPPH